MILPAAMKTKRKSRFSIQKNILAGVLTLVPLWVTWLVFSLVFSTLSKIGVPWVKALSTAVAKWSPTLALWLIEPWFQQALAALFTLAAIYVLGFATTQVIGKQTINLLESWIERIPFVKKIYGSTKKLLAALQAEPEKVERVVLISFPSDSMKTVGLVTATFRDKDTGQDLAAVYVPTTPNPTSGYLEIVPTKLLTSTDMSIEDAMSFIISGGAVAPKEISFGRSSEDIASELEK